MRNIGHASALLSLIAALTLAGAARAQDGGEASAPRGVAPRNAPAVDRAPAVATISLEEAVRIFRARSFDLVVSEAAVASAEGDLTAAKALPNPNALVSWQSLITSRAEGQPANGFLAQISDSAAIENTLSGKRGLKRAVARAALAAQKMQRRDAQRLLETTVKLAYVTQAASAGFLRFSRESQAFSTQLLELSRVRTPSMLTDGQLALVEVDKTQADIVVIQAESSLEQSRAALAFLLGARSTDVAYDVEPTLRYDVPAELVSADAKRLVELAIEHRPDLAASRLVTERARKQSSLVSRQVFPDITLSFQYTELGVSPSAVQPPMIALGASFNLPVFYQLQGEKRRAEADITTQTALANKTSAQIVSDVRTALATYQSSRRIVEIIENTQLSAAKRARDVAEIQWRAGTVSLLDLLIAARQYVATNQAYWAALETYWSSVFTLEQAIGLEPRR